jgi:hypothetical protein
MSDPSQFNGEALLAKLWALHELAEQAMLTVAREKPRRPWYRKRAARAIKAYEDTLAAVPLPPDEHNATSAEYREAVRLAKIMHRRNYAKVAPKWEPLDTTLGVISQLDNMHAGTMDLLDWAESLLCNAMPMSHCTQEEWDAIILKWRDQKHGVSEPNDKAKP